MYYVMRASAPSLHRESTDSLIHTQYLPCPFFHNCPDISLIREGLTKMPKFNTWFMFHSSYNNNRTIHRRSKLIFKRHRYNHYRKMLSHCKQILQC